MAGPTPTPTPGAALGTSGATVAGITTPPAGFSMADFREYLTDSGVDPDDATAVSAFVGAQTQKAAGPGKTVLWGRDRDSGLGPHATPGSAPEYLPYWVDDAEGNRNGRTGQTKSLDEARNEILRMSERELEDLADRMVRANLLDEESRHDIDEIEAVWDKLVAKSARYFDAKVDMTPFDILDRGIRDAGDGTAAGRATTPQRVMDSEVTLSDSTHAWGLLRAMLRSELGRAPSDAEVDGFQAALNEAQTKAPVLTTSTATTNAAGDRIVNTTKSGGMDAEGFAEEYVHDNMDAEYAEYQAATTYFDAFTNAIKRPV